MKKKVASSINRVNGKPPVEQVPKEPADECEDEMKGMAINYSDFCKDWLAAFPTSEVNSSVVDSRDILSDDF